MAAFGARYAEAGALGARDIPARVLAAEIRASAFVCLSSSARLRAHTLVSSSRFYTLLSRGRARERERSRWGR